jgi:hypothetical protein
MDRSMVEKVYEDTARRLGISVWDLRQRLEAEAVMRGPRGRNVMADVWQDQRQNPLYSSGPSKSAAQSWEPQPRGTGWQAPTPLGTPPGIAIVDRLCIEDAERQKQAAQSPDALVATLVQMMAAMLQQNQMMLALLAQQEAAPAKLRRI